MDATDARAHVALGKLLVQHRRWEEARAIYEEGSTATGLQPAVMTRDRREACTVRQPQLRLVLLSGSHAGTIDSAGASCCAVPALWAQVHGRSAVIAGEVSRGGCVCRRAE